MTSSEVLFQLLNTTLEEGGSFNTFDTTLLQEGIDFNDSFQANQTGTQPECHCGAPNWLRVFALAYSQHVHGFASLGVCCLGALANTLNLVVLTRRELRSAPVNRILSCIALVDMLLMLDYIPFAYEIYLDPERAERRFLYPWVVFFIVHMHSAQVLHTISIMLTLLLASWRCLTLTQLTPPSPTRSNLSRGGGNISRSGGPGMLAGLQSSQALMVGLLGCVVLPLLLCTPSFLCFTIKPMTPGTYSIALSNLANANGGVLYHFHFWMYAVLVKLVPCMLLTFLTVCLIRALIRANRHSQRVMNRPEAVPMIAIQGPGSTVTQRSKKASRRTDRTTRMLVAVTILFVVTEFPQAVLGLLSGINGPCFFLTCYQLLGDILDILALINGAVNFILYCAMSRQFRATFCRLFVPLCITRCWQPMHGTDNEALATSERVKNGTLNDTGATYSSHPAPPSELNLTSV